MEEFAVIMLVIILLAWHHLMNWFLRLDHDEDSGILILLLIFVTIAVTIGCVRYIIVWGVEII